MSLWRPAKLGWFDSVIDKIPISTHFIHQIPVPWRYQEARCMYFASFCGVLKEEYLKILVTSPSKFFMVSRFIHYTLDNFTNTSLQALSELYRTWCVFQFYLKWALLRSRVDPVQGNPLGLVGQLFHRLDNCSERGLLIVHRDLQIKILLVLLADTRIFF